MNVKPFLRSAQKFALENSPTILSGVAVIGAITTSVLAAKAGYSSACRVRDEEDARTEILDNREKVELVWKEFIPPAVVGTITLVAIIGANRIGTRRAAALAAAFAVSEKMAEEYRAKVIEHMGTKKEEMVRSDVARDRIQRVEGLETIVLGDSQIIFYDSWSDRAFPATIAQVEAAVNRVNYEINQSWAVSLSEFYDYLGLNKTAVSDDYGWNTDEQLDPYYTACLLPDGRPAREIRYNIQPFQHFNRIG